jgi:hypothetical protein
LDRLTGHERIRIKIRIRIRRGRFMESSLGADALLTDHEQIKIKIRIRIKIRKGRFMERADMTHPAQPDDRRGLIRPHGNYRHLKCFQVSEVVYDATVKFCNRFINPRSRTHDQMVQAARSGKQNIAEGSQVSAVSRKSELKLVGVARASLEELLLDYEDSCGSAV